MADHADRDRPELEGRYANYFGVGVNSNELVIDFGQFYGLAGPTLHTRIIMTQPYARELLALLSRSMSDFDAASGRAAGGEPPAGDGADPVR